MLLLEKNEFIMIVGMWDRGRLKNILLETIKKN